MWQSHGAGGGARLSDAMNWRRRRSSRSSWMETPELGPAGGSTGSPVTRWGSEMTADSSTGEGGRVVGLRGTKTSAVGERREVSVEELCGKGEWKLEGEGRRERGGRVELTSPPLAKKARIKGAFGAVEGAVVLLIHALGQAEAARTVVMYCLGADLVIRFPFAGANIEAPA